MNKGRKPDRRGFQPRHKVVKITISLPRQEADYVERVRKMNDTTRSSVIRDAIREKIRAETKDEKVRRCAEGYRRMPETEEEIAELQAMQQPFLESLPKEDW